jgi:hypothetical protein
VLRATLSLLAAGLALAGPAAAQSSPQGSVTLDPATPGRASHAALHVSGGTATSGQPTPQAIVVAFQRGFVFDATAAAERCTPQQAQSSSCPEASRIGKGSAVVNVSGALFPGGSQDFTATIDVFIAPPAQKGDLAGVVVRVSQPQYGSRSLSGRLVPVAAGPFGAELRFEGLDQATQGFPGVTVTLKQLDVNVGTERTVTTTKVVRKRVRVKRGKHGARRRYRIRKRTVRTRTAHALITNPATCTGAWYGQLRVVYADHQDQQDLSTPCSS